MSGTKPLPFDLGEVCTNCVPLVPPQPQRLKVVFSGVTPIDPETQEDVNGTWVIEQVPGAPCQYFADSTPPGISVSYIIWLGGLFTFNYDFGPGQSIFTASGGETCLFTGSVTNDYTEESPGSAGYFGGSASFEPG